MKRIYFLSFIIILLTACDREEQGPEPSDLEGIFEKVWRDFDQNYSYFPIKSVDWDSVYNENRPKIVNGQISSADLAVIIAEMTLALEDLHVRFTSSSRTYQYQNREQFLPNLPNNARNYLSPIFPNSQALTIGNIENSNLLYVRVKILSGELDYEPLQMLDERLSDKEGLIIDLRENGGGNDQIARDFVNRLTTEDEVFGYVRFRNGPKHNDFGDWAERKLTSNNSFNYSGPIVVLTNRGVVSSAESFVLMLKSLPNTILVGDTTRGSSGNPAEFELSNGWSYRISRWQNATPNFEIIEDKGIAPDVTVMNTEESMEANRDLILEKAIEILSN